MYIDISSIRGAEGAVMPFHIFENMEGQDYPGVVFLAPVACEGTVTEADGLYYVEGKGKIKISLPCDRCLAPVEMEETFLLQEKYSNTESSDEEIETFMKDTIDLAAAVKKNILLHIPMKVVCKEDCKGLCPVCGKDLNKGDCGCDTSYINPRFESLRSLFKVDEEV